MSEIRTQGRDRDGRETTTITLSEPIVISPIVIAGSPSTAAPKVTDQLVGTDAVAQETKARNMAQAPSESIGDNGVSRFGETKVPTRPTYSPDSFVDQMDRRLKITFSRYHSEHGKPANFSVRWSAEFVDGKPSRIHIQSYDLSDEERNEFATLVQKYAAYFTLNTPVTQTFSRTYLT